MVVLKDAISYWEDECPWLLDNTEEEAFEHGKKEQEKEDIVNFYKKGVSKDLILKSLGITEEYFNEVLKENNIKIKK